MPTDETMPTSATNTTPSNTGTNTGSRTTSGRPRHRDCRNCAPVDVLQGYCHLTRALVRGDEPACERHDPLPRCGCCAHYLAAASDQPYLGRCRAVQPPEMTYPDLVAVTCEHFCSAHAAASAR